MTAPRSARQWIEAHGGTWDVAAAIAAMKEAAVDIRAAREHRARVYLATRELRKWIRWGTARG